LHYPDSLYHASIISVELLFRGKLRNAILDSVTKLWLNWPNAMIFVGSLKCLGSYGSMNGPTENGCMIDRRKDD